MVNGMDAQSIVTIIQEKLGSHLQASRLKVKNYHAGIIRLHLWISIDREAFHFTVNTLKSLGRLHLSTAMAYKEYEDRIELIYPFALKMDDAHYSEFMIIASVDIPHNDLTIRTITDIVPGALFMEREVMEMIGIVIEDIPDSRRLFTPSSLQDGYFPLRNGKNKEDSK